MEQISKYQKMLIPYASLRRSETKSVMHIHKNQQIEVTKTAKTNPKKFWAHVKNKTTSSSTIGDIKDKDTILSDNNKKASAFCQYFSSVFTIEDNSYPELNLADPDSSNSVIEFDESDLNKAPKHINVYKSAGPGRIHNIILYETRNIIAAPLKKIFETSLLLKELPYNWQTANISTIHKKGIKSELKLPSCQFDLHYL